MKKWLMFLLGIIFFNCYETYIPKYYAIVNFDPLKWNYEPHRHLSYKDIQVFFLGDIIPKPYEIIGKGSVPLHLVQRDDGEIFSGTVKPETAIKALRIKAWEKGCDAIIVRYHTEKREKELPGMILPSPFEWGPTLYTPPKKETITLIWVVADFIIWK